MLVTEVMKEPLRQGRRASWSARELWEQAYKPQGRDKQLWEQAAGDVGRALPH
jgi:hypothetical protein